MNSLKSLDLVEKFRTGPKSYDNAVRLARLGCVAVGVRAVYTLSAFFIFRPSPDEVIAQLRDVRGIVTLDDAAVDLVIFERVSEIFVWISASVTGAVILLCAALGVWQWRRPGRIMPMICLLIIALSAMVTFSALQDPHIRSVALEPQNMLLLALKPFLVILLVAAYRGGRFCEQYRKEQLCP